MTRDDGTLARPGASADHGNMPIRRRVHPAALVTLVAVAAIAGLTAYALAPAAALADAADDARVIERPAAAAAPADAAAPASASAHPADVATYNTAALPLLDVTSITPALPVDDDPTGALTGQVAQPRGGGAPVFAAPGQPPVGYLPRDHYYGGTTVPVVIAEEHWVKVLLPGRQGLPPAGDSSQLVGWLRTADVDLTRNESYVEVHLAAHTIDIVTATGSERVADMFAWGKPSTPTPSGRTFVMWTTVVPEFKYTEGHPVVYLGVQSPVMAGFDGGEVAVTAFHYYRERAGDTSFGCIYLDGPATDRLAQLPAGTPVIIHP